MPISLAGLVIGCGLTARTWEPHRSNGCCCGYPDVTEVAVYPVPDPVVGDQVMAALVLTPGAELDVGIPGVSGRTVRPGPEAVAAISGSARRCHAR